jgi:hypothetical protein
MTKVGAGVYCFSDVLTISLATWDSPPRPNDPGYSAFKTALARFIASREVYIPEGGKPAKHDRKAEGYSRDRIEDASELDIGQDPAFQLMDFQVFSFTKIVQSLKLTTL